MSRLPRLAPSLGALLLLATGCAKHSPTAPTSASATGWQPTNGPYAAIVRCVAITPGGTVLAGSPAGLLRSIDGGAHWSPAGSGLGALSALAVDPGGTVFACGSNGLFRSSDDGVTWSPIHGAPSPYFATALATVAGAGEIFAAEPEVAVYRSSDLGDHWTSIAGNLPDLGVSAIAATSDYLWVATPSGIYRTARTSIDWSAAMNGIAAGPAGDHVAWTVFAAPSGDLFAGTTSGLYHSTDHGDHWAGVSAYAPISFAADPHGELYGGTSGPGVMVSASGGTTWDAKGPSDLDVLSLAAGSGRAVAGLRGQGVLVSIDHGASWNHVSPGPPSAVVEALATDRGGNVIAGADPGGLFRSADGGASWTPVGPAAGYATGYVADLERDAAGTLYAADDDRARRAGLVEISHDDGLTWTTRVAASGAGSYAVAPGPNGRVYFAAGLGVSRSADGGMSWSATALSGVVVTALAVTSSGSVIAGGPAVPVERSDDEGASWHPTGLAAPIYSIAVTDDDQILAATPTGIACSRDAGASWQWTGDTGPSTLRLFRLDGPSGRVVYAAGREGVFRYDPVTRSWTRIADAPSQGISALAGRAGGALFAGTPGFGVLALPAANTP